MGVLADFATAGQFRDVVVQIVRGVLRQERPPRAYGTVTSINRTAGTAAVQFPGEGGSVNVPMRTIQPYDIGAVVRVAGETGDRFIDEVVGGAGGYKAWIEAQWLYLGLNPQTTTLGGGITLQGNTGYRLFAIQNVSGELRFTTSEAATPLKMTNNLVTVVGGITASGTIQGGTVTSTGAVNGASVVAGKVRAGSGTNSDPGEPFHTYGAGAGYSFESRNQTKRWVLTAPDSDWASLWMDADRLKVGANGRVMLGRDAHGMTNNIDAALFVGQWFNAGGGTNAAWNRQTVVLHNGNANGSSGVAMWNSVNGVAPIMMNYGPNGEAISFVNNSNTAYIPIYASAFTVNSTERVKVDVENMRPDNVGKRAQATFRAKIKAVPPRRWAKKVRTLHVDPETLESHEHVCGQDCEGSPENPCPIGKNDQQPGLGLVAEELEPVIPEAIMYGADGLAEGIDLVKVVGVLWAAVQELSDEVDSLRPSPPAPRS